MSSTPTGAVPARTGNLLDQNKGSAPWRLRVLAEADPSALSQVLQPFQRLNVVPLRVRADRLGSSYIEVAVEVAAQEIHGESFRLVVAKLSQIPCVIVAVACD